MSGALTLTGKTDEQLKLVYTRDPDYLSEFHDRHFLTDRFLKQYHDSLFYYRHFYDDFYAYGNPDTCTEAFYFVPGFSGTPGQIKFGFPSFIKVFGSNIYAKGLYLDEFSCCHPNWIKYTEKHLEKRRQKIVQDIKEMTERFPRVRVLVSSTGFYDFLAAYPQLGEIKNKLILYWVSCAPDQVSGSIWESYFYRFNGFTYAGMKWYSCPNHQCLKFLNPECGTKITWKYDRQKNVFYKNDLESRFFCFGLLWSYISSDCFNFVLKSNLSVYQKSGQPIDIETHVLAATKDGFWDDSRPEVIEKTLDKYLVNKRVVYKKASHLWVVTPENLSELMG